MNRILTSLLLLSFLGWMGCTSNPPANADSEYKQGSVLFYNVENLFDTLVQEGHQNEEFSPQSEKKWNSKRYQEKLDHLARAIQAADSSQLPNIIGFAEVENRSVVMDLIQKTELNQKHYSIIHQDSRDERGIDVALIHDQSYQPISNAFYPMIIPGDRPFTRDILYTKGVFLGDTLHLFVNHWPSRWGGKKESDPKRAAVALKMKQLVDSIYSTDINPNILIMGDFNDHPPDSSLSMILRADSTCSTHQKLVNLAWEFHAADKGTYNYRGDWGMLDQFIVSKSLCEDEGLKAEPMQIIKKDWMLYQNQKGAFYPSRTYGGPNYYGGYSDHLPILVKIRNSSRP
jgi:endonuclease/exonuclease/phosphatase family metal-dependent hydrolase